MAQQLYLEGFTDARCNGLYDSIDGRAAADGSDDAQHAHYVNSSGVHLFHSTAIRKWCLKDSYEPGARSAKAIATWGVYSGTLNELNNMLVSLPLVQDLRDEAGRLALAARDDLARAVVDLGAVVR